MAEYIFNKEQRQAIEHQKGPLLIIAGAGTGKTTVITQRIKHLIVEKNISPSSLLALTFTDKAAREMEERVDILLPYGYTNLWIHTFHSFCDRILRDEAHNIGLDSNYKLITEAESVLFTRRHIFDLGLKLFRPLGNPTKFLEALLTHFSRLKDEDISPEEYVKYSQGISNKNNKSSIMDDRLSLEDQKQYLELATAYKAYEELKAKEGVMDFSDLISNTLKLFRQRPNVLKRYQKQFLYILVDEFQDTNYAQNELAILLAGHSTLRDEPSGSASKRYDRNITVVADDDQSIYRFRGAAVSNVLQFKKNFPKAKIITLTQNYRSTQIILDRAYALIQHNNPNRLEVVEKIDKKLKSHSGKKGEDIEVIHQKRAEDEADAIAKKIKNLNSEGYSYNEMAILVRANNHAQLITRGLQLHRIPYQFLGPGYLFQQEEIKDLIAYLTFLTDLSDSVSLFRVLSMDIFDIPYAQLNYFMNFAKRKNMMLFEALNFTNQTFLTPATQKKLSDFRKMAERHLERVKKDTAGQILYYFLVDSKMFEALEKITSAKDEIRVQNIAKFFDRIKNFETEREDANIFTLVEFLTLMMQMGDSPLAADIDVRDLNAVNILTIHSAKGLEFKVVFLANLVSERFPSRERAEKIPIPKALIKESLPLNTDFHQEEERRLFYVGMTRAKEKLFFTAADFYGSGKRVKKLSPFVYEALPELIKEEVKQKVTQLSLSEVLSVYKTPVEKDGERIPFKINHISYSNLQMFDICPLHYKAKVIFSIPTPPSAVQSFGISLHNTLFNFYKRVQDGNIPTLSELKGILKKEWIPDGYNSKKYEIERYNQALSMIKNYYKKECSPPLKPLALELPFSFSLKNGVKILGKIDRIQKKGKGLPAGRQGIEIIDYKTGEDNPKAQKAHELQLTIYALAATRVKDEILNRKPEDITLTLYFLEGNIKKSMSFNKEGLDELENKLIEKIEEIEKSDFKCSKNILCLNCEFRLLCNTQV